MNEAFAKSVPVAEARARIESVDASISSVVKPSFASSTLNPATSVAVNFVVSPSAFAFSVSEFKSSSVAFVIAPRLAIAVSKLTTTLNALLMTETAPITPPINPKALATDFNLIPNLPQADV